MRARYLAQGQGMWRRVPEDHDPVRALVSPSLPFRGTAGTLPGTLGSITVEQERASGKCVPSQIRSCFAKHMRLCCSVPCSLQVQGSVLQVSWECIAAIANTLGSGGQLYGKFQAMELCEGCVLAHLCSCKFSRCGKQACSPVCGALTGQWIAMTTWNHASKQ